MAAQAHYTVKIPVMDRYQNLLKNLTMVSHQWLQSQLGRDIQAIHSEGPHAGHEDPYSSYHHLKVLATDSPEVDSTIKQLAAHVGELTNHPYTFVMKQGDKGPQSWTIMNKMHDGGPAHPDALYFGA